MISPEQFRRMQEEAARASQQGPHEPHPSHIQRHLLHGLGALAGAVGGYALLRIMDSDRGREKTSRMLENLSDQCAQSLQKKIDAMLDNEGYPTFGAFSGSEPADEGNIKEADFEVLDDEE